MRKINIKKTDTLFTISSIFSFLSSLMSILILFAGYLLVKKYSQELGDIVILNSYLAVFIPFANKIIDSANMLPQAIVSIDRISSVLKESIHDDNDEYQLKQLKFNHISFRNYNFSYSEKNVFNDLDIDFDKSEKLVLIQGKSGVGKSTLLTNLFNGYMYENIFLNDIPTSSYSKSEYQNMIGFYHNSHGIFTGTVIENLVYGNENIDMNEIEEFCKLTDIYDRISELQNGFYTTIDAKTPILSTGEIQRLSLARTFIKKAPLTLLDEPFSNLDEITTNKIITNIKKSKINCIIVAHKLDKIELFDKVILLKEGGNYCELSHKE